MDSQHIDARALCQRLQRDNYEALILAVHKTEGAKSFTEGTDIGNQFLGKAASLLNKFTKFCYNGTCTSSIHVDEHTDVSQSSRAKYTTGSHKEVFVKQEVEETDESPAVFGRHGRKIKAPKWKQDYYSPLAPAKRAHNSGQESGSPPQKIVKTKESSRKHGKYDTHNAKTTEKSRKPAGRLKGSNSTAEKEENKASEIFSGDRDVEEHEKSHSFKNSCLLCSKAMATPEELFFHLHKNHSEHFCFWCNLFKSNPVEMKEHKERCPPEMKCRRKCHFCPTVSNLGNDFEDHVINCHGPKDHRCSRCEESFSSLLALNDHQKEHQASQESKCLVCRREFLTDQEMIDHVLKEHIDDKTAVKKTANLDSAEDGFDEKVEVKENHRDRKVGIVQDENKTLVNHNDPVSQESNGKERDDSNNFEQDEDEFDEEDIIYDDDVDRDADYVVSDEETKDLDSYMKASNRKKMGKTVCNMRKKSITCKFLEKKVKNLKSVQKQKDDQTKSETAINCRLCQETFMYHFSEIRHMLQTHKENFCLWCNVAFKDETEKSAHNSTCIEDGLNKKKRCHVCAKRLANKARYESHFLTVHGKDYDCNECSSVFASHYLLARHKRLHEPEEEHQCPRCPKVFTREINMVKHLRQIHKVLKPKVEKKETFPCECQVCQTGFYSRATLAEHIKFSHMDEINEKIVDNPKYTVSFQENHFLCKKCGKNLPNEDEQAIHMASHLGALNKNNCFICDVCGKVFHKKSLFNSHRGRHTTVKSFQCPKCEKKFHVRSSLLSHLQTHRVHKEFVCDICGRAFKSHPSLRMHSKRHDMDRCHMCKYCNKTFRSYDGLKYHWVVNHPEEVQKRNLAIFPCSHCAKVLATKTQLDRHLAKHGLNKNYACEICDNKYSTIAQLNSHIKNSHSRAENIFCHACDVYFRIPSKMLRHMGTQKHNENCLKQGINQNVFYEMLAKLEKQMVDSVDLTQYRGAKTSTKYRTLYQNMGGSCDKDLELQAQTELVELMPNSGEDPESVTLDLANVQYISQLPKEVLEEVEISDSDHPLRTNTEVIVLYDQGSDSVSHGLDAQAVETLQSILSLSNPQ